jgi:hypothetical protein
MTLSAADQAAAENVVVRWRTLVFIDFDGDPVRVTTGLYPLTVSASGDAELDGSYEPIDHRLLSIGDIDQSESGNGKQEFTLSALPDDVDLFNVAADRTKWQGRVVRVWQYFVDSDENLIGQYNGIYTGYCDDLVWNGDGGFQTVTLEAENYLTVLNGSSNKNYLMQSQFDAGDLSPLAILASANGLGGGGTPAYGGGGAGDGGGTRGGGGGGTRYVEY